MLWCVVRYSWGLRVTLLGAVGAIGSLAARRWGALGQARGSRKGLFERSSKGLSIQGVSRRLWVAIWEQCWSCVGPLSGSSLVSFWMLAASLLLLALRTSQGRRSTYAAAKQL